MSYLLYFDWNFPTADGIMIHGTRVFYLAIFIKTVCSLLSLPVKQTYIKNKNM